MSISLNIFCETDFLESFFQQVPPASLEEIAGSDQRGIHSDWDNAWLFISSNKLYINKTIENWAKEIREKKGELNQFDWAMLNLVLSQGPIVYSPEQILNQPPSDKEYNACFLVDDQSEEIQKTVARWGVMCFSNTSFIRNASILSKVSASEYNIVQNETFSWQSIKEKLLPNLVCNSMLIIDPYIANNSLYNLPELFKEILPSQIPENFELTIITSTASDFSYKLEEDIRKGRWLPDSVNFQVIILDYTGFFSEERSEKLFHDRSIMTNYYKIDSGKGFSLRRKNQNSDGTTKLSNRYVFTSEERDGYLINLKIIQRLYNLDKPVHTRLLSYINELYEE